MLFFFFAENLKYSVNPEVIFSIAYVSLLTADPENHLGMLSEA